ncbi:MAG: VOC family protein [Candidatus Micrarchaeota archaeon]|nr:VOC family protein [Candidatus Micrarchaeota archaeon]
MDPVVHFEMPAEDRKRMISFYSQVFGWETKQLGPEMGDFVTANTTESGNSVPKKPGTINGGFYQKTGDVSQTTTVTIQVNDIKAYRDRIVKAGGRISGDIMDMPGLGLFLSFFDTEGNRVNLMQPAR